MRSRWREAEQRGFDVVWNCDAVVEPDRPRHVHFAGRRRWRCGVFVNGSACEGHRLELSSRAVDPRVRLEVTGGDLSRGRVRVRIRVCTGCAPAGRARF
jgi:hypothetical protein